MDIYSTKHAELLQGLLDHFEIKKPVEALTAKEIVESLMRKTSREGVESLLTYLANHDFYDAPASTRFHGNYKGGLAEHSINVCAILFDLNKKYELLSDESIVIAALMHDLCKVDFYKNDFRNVKDENGQWIRKPVFMVDDQMPLPHGTKSMYILQSFIKLTREEVFLITWHMGPYAALNGDSYGFNNAVNYQPSVALMYTADLLASSLFEEIKD